MGLVEACDAHQDRFQRGILFLPESAKICQHHFEQTLRGTALSQPVGRTSTTPIERPSTHLDRCPGCDNRILQPAQKRIDTAAHFGLEHGRFRCPFAEQNKKDWDHPPSPMNARRIDSGYKTKPSATL